MSDLISRSALIEAFEPKHDCDWYTHWIIKGIEGQPTAYDVDAVIEKLQKINKDICGVFNCKNKCCGICVVDNLLRMQIDAVREGGAK